MPQVAVIGSGAAGLMAAGVIAESLPVVVITDRGLGMSNSAVAQGGLQLPPDEAGANERFVDDIRRSARAEVDEARLASFVAEVPATVDVLRSWGLELDHDERGGLRRLGAGGLSEPRVVTSGDQIGPSVLKVLRRHVAELPVEVLTNTTVTDIEPGNDGLTLVLSGTDRTSLDVIACVAATGGVTRRHADAAHVRSSNPPNRNDLLYDALRRRGLAEVDPDLFQYQPFGIVDEPRNERDKCVPESIGSVAGVTLVDRSGAPVIDLAEDRREVTAAMHAAIEDGRAIETATGQPGLRLTLSAVPTEVVRDLYPRLHRMLESWGRLGEDLVVAPFLHYQLGGYATAPDGATPIAGLYLAGEMVGGLHGRNRLMGNGITDALVHGRLAGRAVVDYVRARGS